VFNVNLSFRGSGGHAVVTLCGELGLADSPGVASHLAAAVEACGPSVIVDLAGLDYIGYSGLGVLLRVLKWTRACGGSLSLAAPRHQVRVLLEATGLIDVFPVYRSVERAASGLGLFRPGPGVPQDSSRAAYGYPIWRPTSD